MLPLQHTEKRCAGDLAESCSAEAFTIFDGADIQRKRGSARSRPVAIHMIVERPTVHKSVAATTDPWPPSLRADPVPLGWSPDCDLRVAGAIRGRLADIEDEITELVESHRLLTQSLRVVEHRIARGDLWRRA